MHKGSSFDEISGNSPHMQQGTLSYRLYSIYSDNGEEISDGAYLSIGRFLESILFYYFRFSETCSLFDWYDTNLAMCNVCCLGSLIESIMMENNIGSENLFYKQFSKVSEIIQQFFIDYEAIVSNFDIDIDNTNNNNEIITVNNTKIIKISLDRVVFNDNDNDNNIFKLYDELNVLKNNYFVTYGSTIIRSSEIVDMMNKFGKGFSSDNSGDGPNKNKTNNKAKSKNKNVNNEIKNIARSALKEQLAIILGKQGAKTAYKTGAKAVRRYNPKVSIGKNKIKITYNAGNPRSEFTKGNLHLSEITSKYLLSYIKPFSMSARNAKVPRPNSTPSYTSQGFVRGTGAIGTAGFGFIALLPCLSNDRPCLIYTTSEYTLSRMSILPNDITAAQLMSYAGGTLSPAGTAMTNLPFTTSNLVGTTIGNTIQGRLVSAGIKMSYVGTTLNTSGLLYGYNDPENVNIGGGSHNSTTAGTGGYDVARISQFDSTEIKNADRKGMEIVCIPSENNFSDYPPFGATALRKVYPYSQGQSTNIPTASSDIGLPMACIIITGIAGQPFYFEAVQHVEYNGAGVVQSLLTPSATDSVGFEAVQNVLVNGQRRCATDPRKSLMACIKEEMRREKIVMFPESKMN